MANGLELIHRAVSFPQIVRTHLLTAPSAANHGALPVIMVQVGPPDWMRNALYHACQLGRARHATIALVVMAPVQHTAWLGSDWASPRLTSHAEAACREYRETVEAFGLEYVQVPFQYITWLEGTVQAADFVGASTVFAAPPGILAIWSRLQARLLRAALERQGRVYVETASR